MKSTILILILSIFLLPHLISASASSPQTSGCIANSDDVLAESSQQNFGTKQLKFPATPIARY